MLFYLIDVQMSFLEYLTEDNLIEFVIKERVKCTQKQNLSKDRVQHIEQAQTPSAAVQVMTPPQHTKSCFPRIGGKKNVLKKTAADDMELI